MPSRSSIVAISACAALAFGLSVFVFIHTRPSTSTQTVAGRSESSRSGPIAEPPATSASAVPSSKTLGRYKERYENAQNYWEFAQAALPAAAAGNADAQFYLSRVLEQCDTDNRMFFERRGQVLTLDEGLQWASSRHLSVAQVQTVYDRCHQFLMNPSSEFGNSAEWLAKATKAGQPLAQSTTAFKALEQAQLQNFARAGGVPNQDPKPELESGVDPRSLFRKALKSKDPDVLFMISEVQNLLYPARTDTDVERLAWWLTACQRGLDCTANGSLIKETCAEYPECQSAVSSTDLIQSAAKDSWPEVQQRAQDISAKLDAGQWTELIPESADSVHRAANESPK